MKIEKKINQVEHPKKKKLKPRKGMGERERILEWKEPCTNGTQWKGFTQC